MTLPIPSSATLAPMSNAADRLRFRLRRVDRKPEPRIPDVAYLSAEEAETAADEIRGFNSWGEVYSYYVGNTSGTSGAARSKKAAEDRPVATFSLPAEDVAFVRKVAEKRDVSRSSIVSEAIGLLRKKLERK